MDRLLQGTVWAPSFFRANHAVVDWRAPTTIGARASLLLLQSSNMVQVNLCTRIALWPILRPALMPLMHTFTTVVASFLFRLACIIFMPDQVVFLFSEDVQMRIRPTMITPVSCTAGLSLPVSHAAFFLRHGQSPCRECIERLTSALGSRIRKHPELQNIRAIEV